MSSVSVEDTTCSVHNRDVRIQSGCSSFLSGFNQPHFPRPPKGMQSFMYSKPAPTHRDLKAPYAVVEIGKMQGLSSESYACAV